ncbi:MAG: DUF4349 domain-containing protein, partial [Candidatus Omnitrophota bacterium]
MIFKHLKIKRLISSYIDGELTPQEKMLVEKHIQECGACKKYLENLKMTRSSLKKWRDEEVSGDLAQRIRNNFLGGKYKGVAKMKSKKKLFVGVSAGALATLLVFALIGQNYLKRCMRGRIYDAVAPVVDFSPTTHRDATYPVATGGTLRSREAAKERGIDFVSLNRQLEDEFETVISEDSEQRFGSSLGLDRGRIGHLQRVAPTYPAKRKGIDIARGVERKRLPATESVPQGPIVIVEPYLPATAEQEKVIRNADVELEVENVQDIYNKVVKIGKDGGGYLGGANFQEQRTGRITARIILRVPRDAFEDTLDEIRKLGEVKKFNIQSIDVSREYASLTSELNTLKIVYDKIVKKLKEKRTGIEGAIQLESELSPYLRQIEAIRHRLSQYDNLIAMPTITVNLYATSWKVLFKENLKEAHRQFVSLLANLIRAAIDILPVIVAIIFLIIAGYAG